MAVSFYLDSRTNKKGEAPIRVSISIKGERFITSSGYNISPGKWDSAKQRIRKGANNALGMTWNEINSALAQIQEHFSKFEIEILTTNKPISSLLIKREFTNAFRYHKGRSAGTGKLCDFQEVFKMFLDDNTHWAFTTRERFQSLSSHLNSWRKDVCFDDFSEKGLTDFTAYLSDKLQLKNSTSAKIIKLLKWFLRWAAKKGLNTNLAFQDFTPKLRTVQQKVIFLDWEELMKVFNYDIPENNTEVRLHRNDGTEYTKTVTDAPSIKKARDIFCFCCFTSLRYSDVNNLKKSDISNQSITITTIKTTETITIELNKYAIAILDRYKDTDLKGYALPRMTNQRMNVYLKDLCELCEINQPITRTFYRGNQRIDETLPKYELIGTHTGRRTFICNALMLGIPAEIVMKWTGHSDYKSMKPYVDVTNAAKAKAMSLFDKL